MSGGLAARRNPGGGLRALGMIVLMGLFAWPLTLARSAVAGTGISAWDSLIAWTGTTVAIILGLVVILYTVYRGKKWAKPQKYIALGIGLTFLLGGVLNAAVTTIPDERGMGCAPGQIRDVSGNCISLSWDVTFPTTVMGTARDVITEIGDSDGANCDGQTPAPTLAAYGTNAFVDRNAMSVRWEITIDDEADIATAGFSAPDALAFDLQVLLKTPVDANSDGTNDNIQLYMRTTLSKTTSIDGGGNASSGQRDIYYGDTGWGSCAGIVTRVVDTQATDGTWMASWDVTDTPSGNSVPTTPSEWVPVGGTDGSDVDFVSWAAVTRNYGFYGYTLPLQGDTYQILVDIAGPGYGIISTVGINVELQDRT